MKQVNQIRSLFRFLSFISFLFIIGSAGALESGSINFLQFVLQLGLFSGTCYFCAAVSRRRIVLRLRPRACRPAANNRSTPRHTTAHAA